MKNDRKINVMKPDTQRLTHKEAAKKKSQSKQLDSWISKCESFFVWLWLMEENHSGLKANTDTIKCTVSSRKTLMSREKTEVFHGHMKQFEIKKKKDLICHNNVKLNFTAAIQVWNFRFFKETALQIWTNVFFFPLRKSKWPQCVLLMYFD